MLPRRSWKLVNQIRNGGTILQQSLIPRRYVSVQPKSNPKDSTLIWKMVAGGSFVIGVPLLYYHYSRKSYQNTLPKPSTTIKEEANNLVENLPKTVPYLVIGGGPSAFSSARSIRSNDPTSKVLIVTEENHHPYSRTPLTKELWFSPVDENGLSFKQFNGKERSIYFEHEEFYLPLKDFETTEHGGISVVKCHKIIRLDVTKRIAYLDNGQEISYGKCVIATGSKPKNLKVFEDAGTKIQDKVILFHKPEDYLKVSKLLPKLKSLTIIGNGFMASELAFSITERSKKIRSNVKINHVFSQSGVLDDVIPKYLSDWCTDRIKDENVNVIANANIVNVQLDQNQLLLKLSDGTSLHTDLCIVDAGLEPNVDLAESSLLETDKQNGGFLSSAELQLRSNLWVAGDVCSFYDQKRDQRRREAHHDNAIFTGRLAGTNASTSMGKPYNHHPRFWSDLGMDIGFEAIGTIDPSLETFAMFAKDDGNGEELPSEKNRYNRGVIFYLKESSIIGIILWNIFDIENMHTARQVLNTGCKGQDLNEIAKLFAIYPAPLPEDISANDEKETKS